MKTKFLLIIGFGLLMQLFQPPSGFSGIAAKNFEAGDQALVLEGIPVAMRPLVPPTTADAIEEIPESEGLGEIVTFRVVNILQGQIQKRAVESFKDRVRNVFNLPVIYRSRSKPSRLEHLKFEVAVRDLAHTLHISENDFGKPVFRMYFKHYKNQPTTFIMTLCVRADETK